MCTSDQRIHDIILVDRTVITSTPGRDKKTPQFLWSTSLIADEWERYPMTSSIEFSTIRSLVACTTGDITSGTSCLHTFRCRVTGFGSVPYKSLRLHRLTHELVITVERETKSCHRLNKPLEYGRAADDTTSGSELLCMRNVRRT